MGDVRGRSRIGLGAGFAMVAAWGMAACSGPSVLPEPSRTAPVLDDLLSPGLEELFERVELVPGMAVAVVRDTSVILLRGFGVADVSSSSPVGPDTPFYIASSTKSFTGTAAAILADRGVWDLEDPAGDWIPGLNLPDPLSPDDVTIRHLLTHTARIDNAAVTYRTAYTGDHDRETLIGLLGYSEVLEPGFDYGNIGYVVASLAMDTAAGASWKDVLETEIFQPLGMERTSADRSAFDGQALALPHGVGIGPRAFEILPFIKDDSNMHAAGGIISTASDLARWLEANLNAGVVDGRQVLSAEAVAEAHRLQATTEAEFYQFARSGYGLGWYHSDYEGDLVLHHFGNYPGFRAHVSFMPEADIGIAVLTNESAQGYFMPEAVATWIYDHLLGKPGLEAKYDSVVALLGGDAERVREAVRRDEQNRLTRPDSLTAPLSAYAGRYTNPAIGTLVVEPTPFGRLRARIGRLHSLMEPIDDRRLLRVELVPGSGEVVEFFLNEGRADSLLLRGQPFRR